MTIPEILEALLKEDWKITIEKIDQEEYQSYAQRGDINCPHRKEYDPKDGHGVSQVWAEGFDYDSGKVSQTLEDSLNKLYDLCQKVVPGKPYPDVKEDETQCDQCG